MMDNTENIEQASLQSVFGKMYRPKQSSLGLGEPSGDVAGVGGERGIICIVCVGRPDRVSGLERICGLVAEEVTL